MIRFQNSEDILVCFISLSVKCDMISWLVAVKTGLHPAFCNTCASKGSVCATETQDCGFNVTFCTYVSVPEV